MCIGAPSPPGGKYGHLQGPNYNAASLHFTPQLEQGKRSVLEIEGRKCNLTQVHWHQTRKKFRTSLKHGTALAWHRLGTGLAATWDPGVSSLPSHLFQPTHPLPASPHYSTPLPTPPLLLQEGMKHLVVLLLPMVQGITFCVDYCQQVRRILGMVMLVMMVVSPGCPGLGGDGRAVLPVENI